MIQNFLKLITGNALSQGIQFIAIIFLTSLYLPYDFGRLGNIQSFGTIFSIFITLQMQHVIPLASNEKGAVHIMNVVFNFSLLTFLFTFMIVVLFSQDYTYGVYLALILGLTNVMSGFLIFAGKFALISKVYVLRALSIVLLQFSFYYLQIKDGLLIGAILGETFTFLFLAFQNQNKDVFKFNFSLARIKKTLKEWKEFSIHGTIQEFLSVAIYALPMIFYTEKFGEDISGQFSIAFKIIFAPTVLISASLSQVLYHRFKDKNGFAFLKKVIWFDWRFFILFFPVFILLLFSQKIGMYFFNEEWLICFQLLPYIFINAMFFLLASPYRVALRFLRLNKLILKIEFLTLSLIVILFLFQGLDVIYFTLIITVISVVQNILIIVQYKKNDKKIQTTF